MRIRCPSCDATLKIHDKDAGKRHRCSKCDEPFVIPDAPARVARVADDEDDDDRPRRRRRDEGEDVGFRCPFCKHRGAPISHSKISGAGWVMFVVLLLFCFPLCFIGLLMQENYRECGSCGMKLG